MSDRALWLLGYGALLATGLLGWLLWVALFGPLVGPFLPSFGQCEAAFAQLRSPEDVDRVRDACRARDGTTSGVIEKRIASQLEWLRLDERCDRELARPEALSSECERFLDEEARDAAQREY